MSAKDVTPAEDAATAILRRENDLLARIDSHEALKQEFIALHRKYNELLEAVSLQTTLFGILERSEDFDSFKAAVRDQRGQDYMRLTARHEALDRLRKGF